MRIRDKLKKRAQFQALQHEFVTEPANFRGKWADYFGRPAPLHIEIGTGRGRFINTLASLHPEINYVGIEKFMEVIIRAYEKRTALELDNLALVWFDATNVHQIFGDREVDRIYLNFSDPWPKKKHADLRLTAKPFLQKYLQILKPGGEVHFKTDNQGLFEFSLESFTEAGWQLKNSTRDLHRSDFEGNVMTEYEEYFAKRGQPIFRVEAVRPETGNALDMPTDAQMPTV